MLSLLVSILVLCVILAIFWWILSMIPIPAEFAWVVRVLVAIIFLIALISLLGGGWGFPYHPILR
jgi:hypothetical protein